MKIATALLAFVALSCNNPVTKKEVTPLQKTTLHKDNRDSHNNHDGHEAAKSTVFITSRSGANIKEQANEASKTLAFYSYGSTIEVLGTDTDWLIVNAYVVKKGKDTADLNVLQSSGYQKAYIKKALTGKISDIVLINSDLAIVTSLTENGDENLYEDGVALKKHLAFELVDKRTFVDNRTNAAPDYIINTPDIKKQNGVIALECDNGIKKFTDKPNDEEQMCVYEYNGFVPFLNQYVIEGSYWEADDYQFIDKANGNGKSFISYPYIAPNKKNIIAVYPNPYDTASGEMEFYSIENKAIKLIFSASFKNWMPAAESKYFWGKDGAFYLEVTPVFAFWDEKGSYSKQYQYLKITVL